MTDNDSEIQHYEHLLKTGKWGRCGVGSIILDTTTNELILSHRSEAVLEPLTFGTIGGAIDIKENKIDAVKREIQEELGLENHYFKFKKLYVHKSDDFSYHNYLAISKKKITEDDCVFNWENIGIAKKSLDEWLKTDNLHPGVEELFQQEDVIHFLRNIMKNKRKLTR